jgi:hypothetical protein
LSENLSRTARMTVEDAAWVLGIQKVSVRKRVHRGTLKRELDDEGREFVYLNLDEIVPDVSTSPPNRMARGSSERLPFLERLGGIPAFVASLAASVYVLGLVALWAPIARTYTHDINTAWYAVSLVPRVTVAGHGLKPVLIPVVVFFVSLLYLVYSNHEKWVAKHRDNLSRFWKVLAPGVVYAGGFLFGLGAVVIIGAASILVVFPMIDQFFILLPQIYTMPGWLAYPVVFVVCGALGAAPGLLLWGTVILFRRTLNSFERDGTELLPRLKDRRLLYKGISIYFAYVFGVAFL